MKISKLQYSGAQWQRDKTRKLIAETRKRKAMQSIIKEELLMIEQHRRTCILVAREERRMIAEGYSRDEINEGIMSFLGQIPGGYVSYLKQYFIEMLMNRMGMDPRQGIIAYALKNVLEEMEWTKITQYFGKGGCRPLTDLLLRGIVEGVAEIGIDKLAVALFGGPAQGFMSGTGREMITNMVRDMTEGMRKPIEDFICTMDFGKLTGGLGGMLGGGAVAASGSEPSAGDGSSGSSSSPPTPPSSNVRGSGQLDQSVTDMMMKYASKATPGVAE